MAAKRLPLSTKRLVSPADVLLSAGVFAMYLPYARGEPRTALAVTLGALSAFALLAKKRFPIATLAVCLVVSAVLVARLGGSYPATPADLVALYATGRYRNRGVALAAAIVTLVVGFSVAQIAKSVPSFTSQSVGWLASVPLAVLAGAWVRTQRTYVRGAEERAARAEREREEEARRRVAEERLRIAREVHDIVGHALMSISVTSSVSARLVEEDPKAGREALETISTVSNSALGEIRSTLSLLRGMAESPTHPRLGLDDLPDLIQKSKLNGLPVTLQECGRRADVPAIVGFTVYRVVQESLTNITRHATRVTKVVVTLTFMPDSLNVVVANDGTTAEIREDGLGIRGMRERVAATGGHLDTTALPGGGFRVHARLPLMEARD